MTTPDNSSYPPELIPRPDPTKLTDAAIARSTEVFRREIDFVQTLLTARLDAMQDTADRRLGTLNEEHAQARADRDRDITGLRDVVGARLAAMEKATDQRLAAYNLLPGQLREERSQELGQLRELLGARLDAMDKAAEVLAGSIVTVPSDVDRAISSLREVIEQRLGGMDRATELLAGETERSVAVLAGERVHIRDEVHATAQALRELVEQRLDSMDTAARVLAASVEKFPSDLDRATGGVREVMAGEVSRVAAVMLEKFTAVDALFASNALALTAALAAQEKAVAEQNRSNTLAITKSEVSTKETIAANAAQTQAGLAGLDAKVTDIKERVVRIESTGAGAIANRAESREMRTEQRLSQSAIVSIIVACVIVAGFVISLITVLHKLGRQPGPVIPGHVPAGREQGQLVLRRMMAAQGQCQQPPGELHLPVLGPGRGGVTRGQRGRPGRPVSRACPPGNSRYGHARPP